MLNYVKLETDGSRTLMERPHWFTEDGMPVSDEYLRTNENMYPIVDPQDSLDTTDAILVEENPVDEWLVSTTDITKTYKIVKDSLPNESTYDIFYQTLELKDETLWETVDGITYRTYNIVDTSLEDMKTSVKDELAEYRWKIEVGGIFHTIDGTQYKIHTDRESQNKLTSLFLLAQEPDFTSVDWKTVDGFVSLDSTKSLNLSSTVRSFIQSLYSNESNITNSVNSAVDYNELKTVYNTGLFSGWDTGNISIFLTV